MFGWYPWRSGREYWLALIQFSGSTLSASRPVSFGRIHGARLPRPFIDVLEKMRVYRLHMRPIPGSSDKFWVEIKLDTTDCRRLKLPIAKFIVVSDSE